MQYALLIYERPAATDGFDADARRAITAEYIAVADDPRVIGTAALQPASMATSVRVSNGDTLVTDGPFADTKDVFGGYFVLEADDLDAAIALAAKLPAARMGGCIEVRPVKGYLR